MTVKCLTEAHKIHIAFSYDAHKHSSSQLSAEYGVSQRTINRVLVEQGVNRVRAPSIKTKPTQSSAVPQPKQLELQIDMIELTFAEKVKCLIKAIFWRTPKQENAQIRK
jgi:hypothetical protein